MQLSNFKACLGGFFSCLFANSFNMRSTALESINLALLPLYNFTIGRVMGRSGGVGVGRWKVRLFFTLPMPGFARWPLMPPTAIRVHSQQPRRNFAINFMARHFLFPHHHRSPVAINKGKGLPLPQIKLPVAAGAQVDGLPGSNILRSHNHKHSKPIPVQECPELTSQILVFRRKSRASQSNYYSSMISDAGPY